MGLFSWYHNCMWVDVIDLRDFYAGPLGRLVRRTLVRELHHLWPDVSGQRVLGLGFATPFLSGVAGDAERTLAVMPPAQGVMHWPAAAPGRVALADDHMLPFADRSMDRILLVHSLEGSAAFRGLLRECWRVMTDGGRLTVVVPNRRGLWARLERTPFAHGRPYSMGQLTHLLRDACFTPLENSTALFFPPFWAPLFRSWTHAVERAGQRFFPTFAGVNIIEVSKQIYAAPPAMAQAQKARDYIVVPGNAAPARTASRTGKES